MHNIIYYIVSLFQFLKVFYLPHYTHSINTQVINTYSNFKILYCNFKEVK